MRIVLTYMSGNPGFVGGVDHVVITRARWLADQGHEVAIVCQGGIGFDQPLQKFQGVEVHPVIVPQIPGKRTGVLHPTLGARIAEKIRELYARQPIDLIDIHDSPLARPLASMMREFAIASTYTIHSITDENPMKRPVPVRHYLRHNEETAAQTVDLCLAVSRAVAEAASRGTAQGAPIAVTPNSILVDLTDAYAYKQVVTDRTKPLDLLFVARLNEGKGLDLLLGALARVEDKTRFRLLVLGDGPDAASLKRLADSLRVSSITSFGGRVSDRKELIDHFTQADVFVSPTRSESFGLTILEAMACGTPTVTSRLPVCEETAGEAALYFPLDDADALAKILMDLEHNRESMRELSQRAHERALTFLPDEVMPALLAAYQDAVDRQRVRVRSLVMRTDTSPITDRPRISVVIPAYNVQSYVVQAIRSAQLQSIVPDEIIVSDDGSSDDTARLAEETGAIVVRGPRGNGSIARNRGAEAATGDLLFFLDGDDWWHPYKIEMHLCAHRAHPGRAFVYDFAKVVHMHGISFGRMGDIGSSQPNWRHFLDWRSWTSGSSFSVSRERYMKIGGFNEELTASQDVDFWVRASHAFGAAQRLPVPLTFYRVLPRSVSKTPKNVARNLEAAMRGWPVSEKEKTEFARQTFLTAARWCDLKSGRQYLAKAGWPLHQLKFWKVLVNMILNSARAPMRRGT